MMSEKKKWELNLKAESSKSNVEDLTWVSPEGIPIFPLYTKEDSDDLPHLGSVPGEEPFVRGTRTTMYVGTTLDHQAICWIFYC